MLPYVPPEKKTGNENKRCNLASMMYYKKQDNLEVKNEWGNYVSKLKNPEMKIDNESNEFFKCDPDINVTLEAGRDKEFADVKEECPDLCNTSWCTARTKCGQLSWQPVNRWKILQPRWIIVLCC